MTFAARETTGISRQRSYWLRCFLGRMLVIVALAIAVCGSANANVCVYKTLYVRSVHGSVSDLDGQVISDANVTIRRGRKVVAQTRTDGQGNFHLKVPRGKYWLEVDARGFAPSEAYLSVGLGFRSSIRSNTLHLVAEVGKICEAMPKRVEDRA
jgi:hypothetical protein